MEEAKQRVSGYSVNQRVNVSITTGWWRKTPNSGLWFLFFVGILVLMNLLVFVLINKLVVPGRSLYTWGSVKETQAIKVLGVRRVSGCSKYLR